MGFGSPTTNAINTTSGNDAGADGITWAQGHPIIVDKFGKLIIWPERYNSNAHRLRPVVSSDGITWTEPTISGFFDAAGDLGDRMGMAYDSVNDIMHGLLVDGTPTDGVIYRRYTITRDGSNNITTVTRDATVNLQIDLQVSTNVMSYDWPTLYWFGDAAYGTYGALLAAWSCQNTLAGSVGTEHRMSMVVLGATATQGATAANWKAPVTASTTTIGNAPAVAYSAIATSATANFASFAILRKASTSHINDLFIFYALNVGGTKSWKYRRAQWKAATNDWSTGLTVAQTLSNILVAGTDTGYSAKEQLVSKAVEDTANDTVWVGFPVWLSNVSGDTWSFVGVPSSDTPSARVDVYSASGAHSYAPGGDLMFDSQTGAVIVSYDVSGAAANYGHVAAYKNGVQAIGNTALTDTTLCDIPCLFGQRVGGNILALYRDTSGTVPFHDHTTTISLNFGTPGSLSCLGAGAN